MLTDVATLCPHHAKKVVRGLSTLGRVHDVPLSVGLPFLQRRAFLLVEKGRRSLKCLVAWLLLAQADRKLSIAFVDENTERLIRVKRCSRNMSDAICKVESR
jgi:hypothetical protein